MNRNIESIPSEIMSVLMHCIGQEMSANWKI